MKSPSVIDSRKLTSQWLDKNRLALVRSALIVAVLAASALFAPRVALGSRYPSLLATAFFALITLLVILRWPTLGLILGLVGGMFIPFAWQGGFNVSQIGLAVMLGVWFLDMLVIRKKFQLVQSRTMLPIFAFVCVSILSFCLGQFSWYPFARNAPIEAQLGGLAINLLSAGAFLLVAHLVNDVRKLELLTWAFIILASIYVFGRFTRQDWADRFYQHGLTAGSMLWTWLVALLGGQVTANRHLSSPKRLALGGIILLTFYVAVTQSYTWKSGWFPPLVALAVIINLRYWRVARYFAIVELIALFFMATVTIELKDWSWSTRVDALYILLNIAMVSPILGMGFANYYWYTPLFPIRGYSVQFNSHNQYVDLIAQTGVVGLACFLWIFGEVGRLGWKLRESVPEGFTEGYVYGALGGLVGTLVAAYLVDWVLPFVYNIGMTGFRASVLAWLFMGGIVSIEQIVRRRAQL
jgi:hypothetical protein